MSAPFKPPRGITVELPYRSLVLRANPDFEFKNRHQLFYEFSNGRTFLEDENLHGAYASSGPISINLTGAGATGGAGTVTQPPSLLDGVSAIGSASQIVGVGTLPIGATLDGVGAIGAACLVTGQFPSAALGGVGASGNAGLILVQSSLSTQVLLAGVSGIGTASPIAGKTTLNNVALSGVLALGVAGTIVIPPTNNVPLPSVLATGQAGIIDPNRILDQNNDVITDQNNDVITDQTGHAGIVLTSLTSVLATGQAGIVSGVPDTSFRVTSTGDTRVTDTGDTRIISP